MYWKSIGMHTTVNSLFSSWKYFRTHTLSENLLLGYYSTTKIFLQRNIISFVYLELKCAHVSDYSQKFRMSLRRYFKPLLPDPRGSLSEVLPSASIAWAPYSTSKVLQHPLPIYLYIHDSHAHSGVSPFQRS